MAIVVNDRERIGEEKLGVLFDGGKVRRRREWRGLRDTLYDYGRWLYILSILAKVIAKPRNVKAMFRYRWFANYLAVPHMLDKFTMGLRDEPLRIVHTAMDFVVKDVAMTIDNSIRGDRRTGNDVEFSDRCVLSDENAMTAFMMGFPTLKAILREIPTMFSANLLNQYSTTHYLDVAQQFGIPGDNYVLGTDLDTPSLEQQSQMLLDAGVILASSSTNTGLLAREFICKGEEA